jgi:Fe-S-cluster containining protein
LTLSEAEAWVRRGHRVSILLEAFAIDDEPGDLARYRHNASRGARVKSGSLDIYVIAIFVADALSGCPNLGEGNACQIYDQRPLVCRIYPMEVNPFVAFRTDQKDCPPEAWETSLENEVIQADGQLIPSIGQLVEASLRADQADALAKVLICEELDLMVTAWKGSGYVVHTPSADDLLAAISRVSTQQRSPGKKWFVRVHDQGLADKLRDTQAQLYPAHSDDRHVYIPLGTA